MPFYQFYHAVPLTPAQQEELAKAVTEIHSRTFSALTALVNIDFLNVTGKTNYIGGHLRPMPSTLQASVREGPSRTPAMFKQLCNDLAATWDRIVRGGDTSFGNDQLRVFITGAFITGIEGGYRLPQAGEDGNWLQENLPTIQENAKNGHEESIRMLESLEVLKQQQKDVVVG